MVGQRLVTDLGVALVVVWRLDRPNQRLVRLTAAGRSEHAPADAVALRDSSVALTMLQPGLQPLADRRLLPADAADGPWRLVAPIRFDRQLIGLVTLLGAKGQAELADEDRRWANLLVSLIADDLVARHQAMSERQRGEQLQALIDALPEAAAIADETGRTLVANASLRARFGLAPESLAVGVDLPTLLGQVEQLPDRGGKRSVVPRLRAVLAGRETTTLPLLSPPADGQGTTRLVVTPVSALSGATEPGVASLVRIGPGPRPERPARTDQRPAGDVSAGMVDVGRLTDLVTVLGRAAHLGDVLDAGVEELRGIFGASAGSILLRRTDGTMVRRSPSGFAAAAFLEPVIDPATIPAVRTAIAERRPVVLRRSGADGAGIAALDRAGSHGALIIPLLVGEEVVGLAGLAYVADPADMTADEITLASGLGRYLAAAVTNARNWDRWGVAQRYLLTVIEQLPQAVIVVDATDGSLAVANRAADELWATDAQGTADTDDVSALGDVVREPAEIMTMAGRLILHDADGMPFPPGASPMERTIRLGEHRLGEPLTVVRTDGTTVRVVGSHVPIVADDGRTVSAVGVYQDIEQLREVDRAKDEFLSVVAHELRNPLTSLRGNIQLVQRRLRRQSSPARTEDIERLDGLVAQTDRINELVGRLLDVSRADLGRIALEYDDHDGTELITRAVETARGLATGHTIVLAAPEALPVTWDRLRVEQVVGNLLSNAIKYTAGGEVRVTLEAIADGQVEIAVADDGDGMPDAVKARVFERYYRGSQGAAGPEGLGIGLYISSRIVAAHGGTLTVSDGPGGGTVFILRLPVDPRLTPA